MTYFNKFKALLIAPVFAGVVFAAPVHAVATPSIQPITCSIVAVGTKDSVGQPDSRFTISGGIVSAQVTVTGDSSCQQSVTIVSWEAPNPKKGKPYDKQQLFSHITETFGVGTHTIATTLPDCDFQVDLVKGTSATDANGGPLYPKGSLLGSLHGGTQACVTPPPTPTPTPTQQPQQPTSLPVTGSGFMPFLVAGAAGIGTIGFIYLRQMRHRRTS
ncbi:MAG TPA: hypothetical protein VGS28_03175 [Candidatus Saccharimonadales bacterium]|nr:hypothetical protein [Candidatus Saccharimonadales bacterium]